MATCAYNNVNPKLANTNSQAIIHFQVNFRTVSDCACGDDEHANINLDLVDLTDASSEKTEVIGTCTVTQKNSKRKAVVDLTGDDTAGGPSVTDSGAKRQRTDAHPSSSTSSSSGSSKRPENVSTEEGDSRSSNKKMNAVLLRTVATTRMYQEYENHQQISQWLRDSHLYEENKDTKGSNEAPTVPTCVLDRCHSELRSHLKWLTCSASDIATFLKDDPMFQEICHFVSHTTPQMDDGACSGPCISNYIVPIVEAPLFYCTTAEERSSGDYGEWVFELVKLYELAAFKLNRDEIPWLELANIGNDAAVQEKVRVMRAELAEQAGLCQDNIPIMKAYAWSVWIKIFEHHQLFQKIPHTIQLKMCQLLDDCETTEKIKLRLAPVMLRANRLTCLFGWNYESFMWNCRNNCRPQMVGVRVAVNNENIHDKASFRIAVRAPGAISSVINEFLVQGKYRNRISVDNCRESVLGQVDMIF